MKQLTRFNINSLKSGIAISVFIGVNFTTSTFAYKAFLDDNTIVPLTSGSQRRLTIKNDENKTIAIEISMLTREISEYGQETNKPVPKEWFNVYPTQLIVEPGDEETIRISWTNAVKLDREKAFRINMTQIKINEGSDGPEVANDSIAKVDFLTNYLDALYVKPKGTSPKLFLNEPKVVTKGGVRLLRLKFENQGTARLWMPDLSLKIQALRSDGAVDNSQSAIEMPNVAFLTLLPFQNQIVDVPIPNTSKSAKYAVSYTYKKL